MFWGNVIASIVASIIFSIITTLITMSWNIEPDSKATLIGVKTMDGRALSTTGDFEQIREALPDTINKDLLVKIKETLVQQSLILSPRSIEIEGRISYSERAYAYVIVEVDERYWIQEGEVLIKGNSFDFKGRANLGPEKGTIEYYNSLGKIYTVFICVSKTKIPNESFRVLSSYELWGTELSNVGRLVKVPLE